MLLRPYRLSVGRSRHSPTLHETSQYRHRFSKRNDRAAPNMHALLAVLAERDGTSMLEREQAGENTYRQPSAPLPHCLACVRVGI